jgi:hypothetical protein
MGDIRLICFNNGLQVVADIAEKDASVGSVTLKNAVQLVNVPLTAADQKEGRAGLAFAPFLKYTEEWDTTGIIVFTRDILTVNTPVRELLNAYNSQFGSGLVLPTGLHSV